MSHTTTGEWQSFEGRMRRRRAQRLVARADAAIDAGRLEEARVCVAEARRLAPGAGGIAAVEHKLTTPAPKPVVPRAWPGAAALLALLTIGGWLLRPHALLPSRDFRPLQLATPTAVDAPLPFAPPPPSRVAQPDTSVVPTTGRLAAASVAEANAAPRQPPVADVEPPAQRDPPAAVRMTEPASPGPFALVPVDGDIAAVAAAVEALPLPAPPPAAAPRVPVPAVRADAGVRGALDRYAAAYSALDADAAGRVWPRVNRAALSRAFDSLASQQVSLGECRIDISGAVARASCAGTATWAPKVGGGSARTEPRRWTFELARTGADWQIVDARVQNR